MNFPAARIERRRGQGKRGVPGAPAGAKDPDRGEAGVSELRIAEMIGQVPEGGYQVFGATVREGYRERFFLVRQSWDYDPARLEWRNSPGLQQAAWAGSRKMARRALTTLPRPAVTFDGPSEELVDFYSGAVHAYFISDPLFRLIEGIDPGALEDVPFPIQARDGEVPFHAVMPNRVVEAVDIRRTAVLIKDEGGDGIYFRRVRFPEGILFDNEALQGAASFSDLDAPGWYWSKDLIEAAEAQGIRGLYAESVVTSPAREAARL